MIKKEEAGCGVVTVDLGIPIWEGQKQQIKAGGSRAGGSQSPAGTMGGAGQRAALFLLCLMAATSPGEKESTCPGEQQAVGSEVDRQHRRPSEMENLASLKNQSGL